MSVYYNAYVDRLWSTAGLPAVELSSGSYSRRPSVFVPDLIANQADPAATALLVTNWNAFNLKFSGSLPLPISGTDVTDVANAITTQIAPSLNVLAFLNAALVTAASTTGSDITACASLIDGNITPLLSDILAWANANAGTSVALTSSGAPFPNLQAWAAAQGI